MAVDPRWTENQRVAQAASGSANELVPALADIVQSGHWMEFTHPMRGILRFASFAKYCDEFLGLSASAVEALLEKTNAKDAARQVRKMLAADLEPLAGHGEVGNGRSRDGNTKSTDSENGAAYVLARLKRDDPDLAQQVIDGNLTANAAAIKAGIRKPRVYIRTDDAHRAVAVLLKHYDRQVLLAALESA